jgi:hypothetical protein
MRVRIPLGYHTESAACGLAHTTTRKALLAPHGPEPPPDPSTSLRMPTVGAVHDDRVEDRPGGGEPSQVAFGTTIWGGPELRAQRRHRQARVLPPRPRGPPGAPRGGRGDRGRWCSTPQGSRSPAAESRPSSPAATPPSCGRSTPGCSQPAGRWPTRPPGSKRWPRALGSSSPTGNSPFPWHTYGTVGLSRGGYWCTLMAEVAF